METTPKDGKAENFDRSKCRYCGKDRHPITRKYGEWRKIVHQTLLNARNATKWGILATQQHALLAGLIVLRHAHSMMENQPILFK